MLTQNEITSLSLSPTKKDFVQIWNELLEVASKLSERWDPTSTNESDPGIVILKALTGIADKLNYNIDKNTLEAFMPTAAQEESMRKLCDMLGYAMKYYQSATTEVTIKYYNPEPGEKEKSLLQEGLYIPKFTVITNSDNDINYFTLTDNYYISSDSPVATLMCMEGQVVKCESSSDNNVITANQVSENNRFYLPETQIAENGIFVYNIALDPYNDSNIIDGTSWQKVDNLNIQARGTRVFKFGFDSYESRPYIEFPEDYSELFNEGIFVYYARTSGVNGNVSPRTLTQLELPAAWPSDISASSFSAENPFSATTGANPETIKQAYNNFKKTVGTFETLVTCRDYMNKIYLMSEYGKPLVSNILVTDIRNDINRAVTICSCDGAGIYYKDTALLEDEITCVSTTVRKHDGLKPVFFQEDPNVVSKWHLGTANGMRLIPENFITSTNMNSFDATSDGIVTDSGEYWQITQGSDKVFVTNLPSTDSKIVEEVHQSAPSIDRFDIVLYPFKSYTQIKSNVKNIRTAYDASFTYTNSKLSAIKSNLEDACVKNIAHNYLSPRAKTDKTHINNNPALGDVLSINNYLKLNAIVATNTTVSTEERTFITENIKIALANAFNMRELDFGESIPFDSIVEVIEKADSRIRLVSLNDPTLYTTFSVLEGYSNNIPVIKEYAVASEWLSEEQADATGRLTGTFNTREAKMIYNKLAVRNVLAGRVPLFNYNSLFKTGFYEAAYQTTKYVKEAEIASSGLTEPSYEEPFTIITDGVNIYTGQWSKITTKPAGLATPTDADTKTKFVDAITSEIYTGELVGQDTVYGKIVYTKTTTPKAYKDNFVAERIKNKNTSYITSINAKCTIPANAGNVSDVTLGSGEAIKFRAPNFITTKTYPAYVNYHLERNRSGDAAVAARATSLFDILASNLETNYGKVISYFKEVDAQTGSSHVKSFSLTQTVSAYKPAGDTGNENKNELMLEIDTGVSAVKPDNLADIFVKSGCVRLTNTDCKARVAWAPADGETPPLEDPISGYEIKLSNEYMTSVDAINNVKTQIDDFINSNVEIMPKECSWTISFDFECVPFEHSTLSAWETFIRLCAENYSNNYDYQILSFKPVEENRVILWRVFDGDGGYSIGKYVTNDRKKLLKFDVRYFNVLPENSYLSGIYLVENIGKDVTPTIIENNEEYRLGPGEYLFIEYTPSATTESGTNKELAAIKTVHGEGTIIKPSGFAEPGFISSADYIALGNSPYKTVQFEVDGFSAPVSKELFSFGANEQVEIREFAEVVLSRDSFANSPVIFVYKNFNGCPELEELQFNTAGNRINNTYTLKDGEYIFYTDKNKAEFAYFTSGTQVCLLGNTVLRQFDIIEISDIFDSSISEIPWALLSFTSDNDSITFKEFQYLTLGKEDSLKNLTLVEGNSLNESWQYCQGVEYTLAAKPDEIIPLAPITVHENGKGDGWEVCSTFDINVSNNSYQTLRNTGGVETSLELSLRSSSGNDTEVIEIKPVVEQDAVNNDYELSFKTNLACYNCGNKIDISDIDTDNTAKSFQFKIFAADSPVIVRTEPGKVVPYHKDNITDIAKWPGETILTLKDSSDFYDIWNTVNLKNIKVGATNDNALRLPITLLPNTYGIFSIYIDYAADVHSADASTWLEVLPGTSHDSITLINAEEAAWIPGTDRLLLNRGLNCIRVNNTCRLFIKASENSEGNLYFDDLRLVNKQLIKYTEGDRLLSYYTDGLNLEQLGYFGINPNDETIIDDETRAIRKSILIDTAEAEIKDALQTVDDSINVKYHSLIEDMPKVQTLVTVANTVNTELDAIKVLGNERRWQLIEQYKHLSDKLSEEQNLLSVLDSNKDVDHAVNQLVTLSDSFVDTNDYEQEALTELAQLRTEAEDKLSKISEKETISDWHLWIGSADTQTSELENYWSVVKKAAIEKINENHNNNLAALAEGLGKTTASDERTKLLELLTELKIANTLAITEKLVSMLDLISDKTDQTVINDTIAKMLEVNNLQNYDELLSLVISLRNDLTTESVQSLITELKQAVDADDNELAIDLVEELTAMMNEVTYPSQGSLFDELDRLESAVESCLDDPSSELSATIVSSIDSIHTKIKNEYQVKLKAMLDKINEYLDELDSSATISSAIMSLKTGSSDVVLDIASQLEAELNGYDALIKSCNELSTDPTSTNAIRANWSTCASRDFIKSAVVDVWPNCMKTRLLTVLDTVSTDSINQIFLANDGLAALNTCKDTFNYQLNAATLVIANLLNINGFNTLFTHIADSLRHLKQANENAELVKAVSNLLPAYGELGLVNEDLDDSVIKQLIVDLQETTSIAKQQALLSSLRIELNKAVAVKKQLLSIVANMLFPNIEKYASDNSVISDTAFNVVKAEVSEIKTKILEEISRQTAEADVITKLAELSMPSYTSLLDLLKLPYSEFRAKIYTFDLETDKVPFAAFYNTAVGLKNEVVAYADTSAILSELDLNALSSDRILAIEVGLDSVNSILHKLAGDVFNIEQLSSLPAEYVDVLYTYRTEKQLLAEIRSIDANREFYYNVPVESSLAIEFNESNKLLNTLLNPLTNYDVNNVNNGFVISKLDIDYLTNGIQIARSSRFN